MNPNFSTVVDGLFVIGLSCGLLVLGACLSMHLVIASFVRVIDSCLAMFRARSRPKITGAIG